MDYSLETQAQGNKQPVHGHRGHEHPSWEWCPVSLAPLSLQWGQNITVSLKLVRDMIISWL